MLWVGFRRCTAPTCATFEIDIWPDFVKFGPHAAARSTRYTYVHATGVQQMCTRGTPGGASSKKRGFDFLAGATVLERATSPSDVQWPEVRRNVVSN